LSKDLSRYHHRDGHENSKDVQRRIDDNRKTMGNSLHPICKVCNSRKMFSYWYI